MVILLCDLYFHRLIHVTDHKTKKQSQCPTMFEIQYMVMPTKHYTKRPSNSHAYIYNNTKRPSNSHAYITLNILYVFMHTDMVSNIEYWSWAWVSNYIPHKTVFSCTLFIASPMSNNAHRQNMPIAGQGKYITRRWLSAKGLNYHYTLAMVQEVITSDGHFCHYAYKTR